MQYINFLRLDTLRMLSKNTILKAIHNIWKELEHWQKLRMLSKNTILKAIHNTVIPIEKSDETANAK